MTKPIMSYEAVIAAAREAHLYGGQEVDLQALAGKQHDGCYYRSDLIAPDHCKTTVCVIGAFFWKHGLLDVRVGADRIPVRSKMTPIGMFPEIHDFVEIPDMGPISGIQKLHDRACFSYGNDALTKLREALGLEPA